MIVRASAPFEALMGPELSEDAVRDSWKRIRRSD